MNIVKILLTDLAFYDPALPGWTQLLYNSGGSPIELEQIELLRNPGQAPEALQLDLDWGNFTDGMNAGCSIFGGDLPFAQTQKSIRIRYKIKTISIHEDIGEIETVSDDFFYQMINMAFGTDPVSGLPEYVDGGLLRADIELTCPAFSEDMLNIGEAHAHLANKANWKLLWENPIGDKGQIDADEVLLTSPVASVDPDHYGFKMIVQIAAALPVKIDGDHHLELKFIPNDGSDEYVIPASISTAAKITINKAFAENDVVYSAGSETKILVDFE